MPACAKGKEIEGLEQKTVGARGYKEMSQVKDAELFVEHIKSMDRYDADGIKQGAPTDVGAFLDVFITMFLPYNWRARGSGWEKTPLFKKILAQDLMKKVLNWDGTEPNRGDFPYKDILLNNIKNIVLSNIKELHIKHFNRNIDETLEGKQFKIERQTDQPNIKITCDSFSIMLQITQLDGTTPLSIEDFDKVYPKFETDEKYLRKKIKKALIIYASAAGSD